MADDGKRIISIDNDADPGEKFPDNVREELGAVIDGRLGMGTGSPGQVLTVENSEIGRAMWADLPLRPVDAPPESSSSVGSRGQYYLPTEAADPGPTYMYVCLADNLWGRYELDLDWP